MKKSVLRIMRSLDENQCAPEYATNQLTVEIRFAEIQTDIREIHVRIYDSSLRLMGADTFCNKQGRRLRNVSLHPMSADYWNEGEYTILVYRNNQPLWQVQAWLYKAYEKWHTLTPEKPTEEFHFFACELCFSNWWQTLDLTQYDVQTIRQLIRTLYRISDQQQQTTCLFVAGPSEKARTFATSVLATYLSGDQPEACFHLPVERLQNGQVSWSEILVRAETCRVLLADMNGLEYNLQTDHLLTMLDLLTRRNVYPGKRIICYGTREDLITFQYGHEWPDEILNTEHLFQLSSETRPEEPEEKTEPAENPVSAEQDDCRQTAEQELEELVGLRRLKTELAEVRLTAAFLKERRTLQLETDPENRNHMIFLGNPGTGKTTVARLIGRLFHQMGLLSGGHTVETNRAELIGEYIGSTEQRIKEAIAQARGGVLFIDEAYTLVQPAPDSKDFGKEVIHALLPVLSEPDPDLIVILAGYADKMQQMLQSNNGLNDRFPIKLHFDDYTPDELTEIARRYLQKRNFQLTDEAETRLTRMMEKAFRTKDIHFGNGRWVHNIVTHGILKNMARRVMSESHPTDIPELFRTIETCDVEMAEHRFLDEKSRTLHPLPRIGFRA